jgi:hypothetical protein
MALNADQYKERCDRVQADAKFDSDYYLDHITRILSEFPLAMVENQANSLEGDLESRNLAEAKGRVSKVLGDMRKLAEKGGEIRERLIRGWANP